MIDEKRLLRVLDRAYKSGGYTLIQGERGIELLKSGEWRYGINADKVSAKLKGKLVEHMDFLPQNSGAWKVYPDGTQSMELPVALQECGAFIPQQKLKVLYTPITYNGLILYQNEDTGVCAAIPSSWLSVAGDTNIMVDTVRGICFKEDEGESASGVCVTKRTECSTETGLKLNALLRQMQTVMLVGADSCRELLGQTDILDDEEDREEDADEEE